MKDGSLMWMAKVAAVLVRRCLQVLLLLRVDFEKKSENTCRKLMKVLN
jgi:hypothetical protein